MFNPFHLAGEAALNQDDYETAASSFLQAIEQNPEVPESYFFLGRSYFFLAKKSEAIPYLTKYTQFEFDRGNPDVAAQIAHAFDLLGQCYEAEHQADKALENYKRANQNNPSCASAWHNKGLLHLEKARNYLKQNLSECFQAYIDAASFLKLALVTGGNNPMFLHSLAYWHEQYVDALNKRIEEAPEYEEEIKGDINTNFSLAIQYYQRAFRACRPNDIAFKNIITDDLSKCFAQYGHYFYQHQNYLRAEEFYAKAVALDSNLTAALKQLGMIRSKEDRFAEARTYFFKSLESSEEQQDRADAWLNIAYTFRQENLWIEARCALNKAKNLAPDDPAILNEDEELKAAQSNASLIASSQPIFNRAAPKTVPTSCNNQHSTYQPK